MNLSAVIHYIRLKIFGENFPYKCSIQYIIHLVRRSIGHDTKHINVYFSCNSELLKPTTYKTSALKLSFISIYDLIFPVLFMNIAILVFLFLSIDIVL